MTLQELRDVIPYDDVDLQVYAISDNLQPLTDALYVGLFDKHAEVAQSTVLRVMPIDGTLLRVTVLDER